MLCCLTAFNLRPDLFIWTIGYSGHEKPQYVCNSLQVKSLFSMGHKQEYASLKMRGLKRDITLCIDEISILPFYMEQPQSGSQ